ncbi:hypothetical protein RUND412_004987 [Rhizina undulata]
MAMSFTIAEQWTGGNGRRITSREGRQKVVKIEHNSQTTAHSSRHNVSITFDAPPRPPQLPTPPPFPSQVVVIPPPPPPRLPLEPAPRVSALEINIQRTAEEIAQIVMAQNREERERAELENQRTTIAIREGVQRVRREELRSRRAQELLLLEETTRRRLADTYSTDVALNSPPPSPREELYVTVARSDDVWTHRCSRCDMLGHRSRDCMEEFEEEEHRHRRHRSASRERPRGNVRYVRGV